MAKLFKSGKFLKSTNNEIKGAKVKNLDTSNTMKSFFHTDDSPAIIVAPFVQAAISMANGNVSIGKIEDEKTYFEVLTNEGQICSIIQDEENITYEFDGDLEETNNLWILGVVILYNALIEKGAKELRDVFTSIKREVKKHTTIANDDAFILCDYLTYRLTSKNKSSLDIDTEKLEKVRRLTLNPAGDIYELVEDLTPNVIGVDGVFEKLSIPLLTHSNKQEETFLGKGNYLFEDELTEEEKKYVVKLSGVVERYEYVDAIETIYDARNREHPKNIVFSKGTSGSGKSFFAKVLSSETGLPYYTISCDEDMGAAMFKGQWVIKDGNMVYEPSFFAQKVSRPCIFEIAESSSLLASKLTQLYTLLDKDTMSMVNDDGITIRRHPHCIIVFTCNTYSCLNDIAPSIVARSATILTLPMMDRDNLRKVILRENDNEPIDSDIMENVLDCMECIENFLKSPSAPKGCESSIRGYAAWADKIQNSRRRNRYNPIYAAKTTILPIISCAINFDENLEKTIIDTIITPVFNFVENGGV